MSAVAGVSFLGISRWAMSITASVRLQKEMIAARLIPGCPAERVGRSLERNRDRVHHQWSMPPTVMTWKRLWTVYERGVCNLGKIWDLY